MSPFLKPKLWSGGPVASVLYGLLLLNRDDAVFLVGANFTPLAHVVNTLFVSSLTPPFLPREFALFLIAPNWRIYDFADVRISVEGCKIEHTSICFVFMA